MVLLLITLLFLIQINAIPDTVIITIPPDNSDPYIEGNNTNLWFKIKTFGNTINRRIYLAIVDDGTDVAKTNFYLSNINQLGDSIKGVLGIQPSGPTLADYYKSHYLTLKGMIVPSSFGTTNQMTTYCQVLIFMGLEKCFLPIATPYNASNAFVSFIAYLQINEVVAAFNDPLNANKWEQTYLVLYMEESDFNNTKSIIPPNIPYIYGLDSIYSTCSYMENVMQYAKTGLTCHSWCADCNDNNDADFCLGSCLKGFDLTDTTCACSSLNKYQIGDGDAATCNCTGDLVSINGICSSCGGLTKPNSEDSGCDCWDGSLPTGADSDICPSCPGESILNDARDGCKCWDGSLPTGTDSDICPECPGQSKLNDDHDDCDCWDGSIPSGDNSDICPVCPGDTVLNEINTECICLNNFKKELNNSCVCEYLFGATMISEAICGCPDTSVLSGDKSSCVCPENKDFNFSTMKCEDKLSSAYICKSLQWLFIIAIAIF